MNVLVIVRVCGVEYLTKVVAESLLSAEHFFLDRSICGKHEYGVEAAQAFGAKEMKTDCFIACALYASPVSFDHLCTIIDENNARIAELDRKEAEREKTLAEIAELENRLSNLRAML